jgi:signal transduction histidine kinase
VSVNPDLPPGAALLAEPGSPADGGLESSTVSQRPGRFRLRLRESGRLLAAEAIAQERRRIAAEVHDLVMQDLSFALAAARDVTAERDLTERMAGVVESSERALACARELVGDLLASDPRPVVEVVRNSARRAARGVPLSFDFAGVAYGAEPDRLALDALVHVVREAVTNAVKHARPSSIAVVLDHGDEWYLSVRDDGCGFDSAGAAVAALQGFGLKSMRMRVGGLGGRLDLRSVPGAGTIVEVTLP